MIDGEQLVRDLVQEVRDLRARLIERTITTVELPKGVVAAPCAIDGCQYAEREAALSAAQQERDTFKQAWITTSGNFSGIYNRMQAAESKLAALDLALGEIAQEISKHVLYEEFSDVRKWLDTIQALRDRLKGQP